MASRLHDRHYARLRQVATGDERREHCPLFPLLNADARLHIAHLCPHKASGAGGTPRHAPIGQRLNHACAAPQCARASMVACVGLAHQQEQRDPNGSCSATGRLARSRALARIPRQWAIVGATTLPPSASGASQGATSASGYRQRHSAARRRAPICTHIARPRQVARTPTRASRADSAGWHATVDQRPEQRAQARNHWQAL